MNAKVRQIDLHKTGFRRFSPFSIRHAEACDNFVHKLKLKPSSSKSNNKLSIAIEATSKRYGGRPQSQYSSINI